MADENSNPNSCMPFLVDGDDKGQDPKNGEKENLVGGEGVDEEGKLQMKNHVAGKGVEGGDRERAFEPRAAAVGIKREAAAAEELLAESYIREFFLEIPGPDKRFPQAMAKKLKRLPRHLGDLMGRCVVPTMADFRKDWDEEYQCTSTKVIGNLGPGRWDNSMILEELFLDSMIISPPAPSSSDQSSEEDSEEWQQKRLLEWDDEYSQREGNDQEKSSNKEEESDEGGGASNEEKPVDKTNIHCSVPAIRYFQYLREKKFLFDAVFVTTDKVKFPVHRHFVIMRSHVLGRILMGIPVEPGKDNEMLEIQLATIHSETLSVLLKLIYNTMDFRSARLFSSMLACIMYLSHRFGILQLLGVCNEFIMKHLNPANVVSLYTLCKDEAPKQVQMLTYLERFMKRRFFEVMKCPEFLELPFHLFKKILMDDELVTDDEQDVLDAVSMWIEFDQDKQKGRNKYEFDLLACVRFGTMRMPQQDETIVTYEHLVARNPNLREVLVNLYEVASDNLPVKGVEYHPADMQRRPRLPRFILFSIGGRTRGSSSTLVEVYDPRADRWIYPTDYNLPFNCAYHGCVTVGKKIYVFGGQNGLVIYNSCHALNMSKPEEGWQVMAGMHHSRCYVAGCVDENGYLWAIGGTDGNHRMSSVERYDMKTNHWDPMPPMCEARSDCAAVFLNGLIWAAGGFNGREVLDTVECYQPSIKLWTLLAKPMRFRRSGLSAVIYKENLVVLGGFDGDSCVPAVDMYDDQIRDWVALPDMLRAKSNFATTVLDNVIYAFGGFDGCRSIPLVEVYNSSVSQDAWVEIQRMPVPKSGLGLVAVNGCLDPFAYVNMLDKLHAENNEHLIKEKEQTATNNISLKYLKIRRR